VPGSIATPQVVVPDTKRALVDFTRFRLAAAKCRVVGVTGSVGTTTTKEMIAAVVGSGFKVLKTAGNLNTYTGFPMTVAALEPGVEVFVAEYAMSAPGEIRFLTEMARPDIAVVLNVGLSHVGMLGSIDAVAAAKQELVEALDENGQAVLNADDPRVAPMAAASRGDVTRYSLRASRDVGVHAANIDLQGLRGSEFDVVFDGATAHVRLPAAGLHNVSNALAAIAAGGAAGIGLEQAAAALESFAPVAGRMAMRRGRGGSTVIDDSYNASPSSMEAALVVLAAEPARPRVAILGDMLELGDASAAAHRQVGRAAAGVDMLIAVGDNAADLVKGAVDAGLPADRAIVAGDTDEAAALALAHLDGGVVLVKASRGAALERVVEQLVDEAPG
jgi:UDP-N-acetylmuramoyl-tripeptide--D-alanyl-D-alanine ligase